MTGCQRFLTKAKCKQLVVIALLLCLPKAVVDAAAASLSPPTPSTTSEDIERQAVQLTAELLGSFKAYSTRRRGQIIIMDKVQVVVDGSMKVPTLQKTITLPPMIIIMIILTSTNTLIPLGKCEYTSTVSRIDLVSYRGAFSHKNEILFTEDDDDDDWCWSILSLLLSLVEELLFFGA
jgi:hypothetical protein